MFRTTNSSGPAIAVRRRRTTSAAERKTDAADHSKKACSAMCGAGHLFTIKQEFLPRTSRITLRPLMKLKKLVKEAAETSRPFRITKGEDFRLKDYDPADTGGLEDKDKAIKTLKRGVELLSHLQEKLYAQDRWALLLIFQAMDAAGKDGALKHVMSGIK